MGSGSEKLKQLAAEYRQQEQQFLSMANRACGAAMAVEALSAVEGPDAPLKMATCPPEQETNDAPKAPGPIEP